VLYICELTWEGASFPTQVCVISLLILSRYTFEGSLVGRVNLYTAAQRPFH